MKAAILIILSSLLISPFAISQDLIFEDKQEIHNFLIGDLWQLKTVQGNWIPYTTLPSMLVCDSSIVEYKFTKSNFNDGIVNCQIMKNGIVEETNEVSITKIELDWKIQTGDNLISISCIKSAVNGNLDSSDIIVLTQECLAADGKIFTLERKNDVISSVNYNDYQKARIYPNPTQSNRTFVYCESKKVKQIMLFNAIGMKIHKFANKHCHKCEVDLHNYPPGPYLLVIELEDFSKTTSWIMN